MCFYENLPLNFWIYWLKIKPPLSIPLRGVKWETCCERVLSNQLKVLPKRYLSPCFHRPPHSTNQGYLLYQPSMPSYKQDSSQQQQQTYPVPAAFENKYDPILKWAPVHLRIQIWMCIINHNIHFTKYLHAVHHKLNRGKW